MSTSVTSASQRAADAARLQRRRRREAMGLPSDSFVDAEPVRLHIEKLRAAGVSLRAISAEAGISHMVISRLLYPIGSYPPSRRIQEENAAALLAVHYRPQLLEHPSAIGAQRRLQALIARGWPIAQIGEEMGMDRRNLWTLIYRNETVHPDTHRRVCEVYHQLWTREPPQDTPQQRSAVTRARNIATRQGWPPPGAWDDGVIDDPAGQPDWSALRSGTSRLSPDEVLDEWVRLRGEVRWSYFHKRVGLSFKGWQNLFSEAEKRGDPRAVKHRDDERVQHWRPHAGIRRHVLVQRHRRAHALTVVAGAAGRGGRAAVVDHAAPASRRAAGAGDRAGRAA